MPVALQGFSIEHTRLRLALVPAGGGFMGAALSAAGQVGSGSELSPDHFQRQQCVAGDKRGILFPPSTVLIGPRAIALLEVNQAQGNDLPPVDFAAVLEFQSAQ